MYKRKAFSLAEIMVAIAIVAILSSVAVTSYRNYVIRARVSEGFEVLQAIKKQVMDYYNGEGRLPTTLAQMNISSADYTGGNIKSLSFTGQNPPSTVLADITLSFDDAIASGVDGKGGGLMLKGTVSGQIVVWQCWASHINGTDPAYLPKVCKQTS